MLIENWTWVGLIPFFPLVLSIFYGFTKGVLRLELSNKWVSASLIWAVLASFLFSFLSLLDLVADPDGTALIDRVANWIGVGVGSAALVGGLDLRFDPLSAVFCLLVSGVGSLIVLYSVVHMRASDQGEKGFARFFGLFIFQFFSMLIFVLADNLLILLFGFAALVMSTQCLMGFLYADESLTRSATMAGTVGLVGFGGLFFSVLMAFRGLSEMGRPGLALSKLEESLPALAVATVDLPFWLGGVGIPLPEILAVGVGVAACALASLWPFLCWLPRGSRGPVPTSILIQTVTTLAAAGYLLARFSPWLALAPITSGTLAWVGAIGAFVSAGMACSRFEITRVMAWSSVSQFGLVLLAVGVGGYTEAVFHVIAHAFSKGVLLMGVGVVVLAVAGERDLRRMGNIGSRLTLTRIDLWIGVFALAGGLPLTAGFFSMQGILEVTLRAESFPGLAGLHFLVLGTFALTSFYLVRMLYLSLYGNTRLPPEVRWEAIEDPVPRILWPMGALAGLAIAGSLIGLPQIWSDLLFSGEVQDSDSLKNFISGVVAGTESFVREPAEQWSAVGQATGVTWLGVIPAVWLYLLRPDWNDRIALTVSRLRAFRPQLGFARRPTFGASRLRFLDWVRDDGDVSSLRGQSFGFSEHFLKFFQSGFLQHYLGFVAAGCFALLLYVMLAGRGGG